MKGPNKGSDGGEKHIKNNWTHLQFGAVKIIYTRNVGTTVLQLRFSSFSFPFSTDGIFFTSGRSRNQKNSLMIQKKEKKFTDFNQIEDIEND